jgi:hypothetical protein
MARLKILSNDDFDKLYKIPQLTDEERNLIFELDEVDKNYLATTNNIAVKINYILHLGYFRISQYFFTFTFQQSKEDVQFILKAYFPGNSFPMKKISNRQYYANRQTILNKYEMVLYSKRFENELSNYLKFLVKQHAVHNIYLILFWTIVLRLKSLGLPIQYYKIWYRALFVMKN